MVSQGHPKKFKEYVDNNWNKTTYGVIFCLDNINQHVSEDFMDKVNDVSLDEDSVMGDVLDMTTEF